MSKIVDFIKTYKEYIVIFFLYFFMLGIFYFTSIGAEAYRVFLNMRRYLPVAVGVSFSIYVWDCIGLGRRKLFPPIIVSLSWSIIHNILDYISNYETSTNINNYAEVAFGGYIFIILVLSRALIVYWQRKDNVFLILCMALFILFYC